MKLIIKEEKYDLSWKEHDVKMRVDGEMGTYPSYAKRVGNLVVNIDPEVFNNGEFGYTVYYTPHIGKAGFKKAESGFMNSSEAMDYADTYIFGADDFYESTYYKGGKESIKTEGFGIEDAPGLYKRIYKIIRDNHINADIVNTDDSDDYGFVELDVDGDWKHDHLRLKYLLNQAFDTVIWKEKENFPSDEDCFRAIYMVYLADPKDDSYTESVRKRSISKGKNRNESYKRLHEQDVEIEVKHEGILEVPEGKNVDDLPMSHFEKLAKKKGLGKITKALNNLQVWNKNDDPKLSKWAGDMIDKLNKKLKKDEAYSSGIQTGWKERAISVDDDEQEAAVEEILAYAKRDDDKIEWDIDYNGGAFADSRVFYIYSDGATFEEIRYKVREMKDDAIYGRGVYESFIKEDKSIKEADFERKSYWFYSLDDPFITRISNSDRGIFTDKNVRNIKILPSPNKEGCYVGSNSPIISYEYPYKEFYGTKENAYTKLKDMLNVNLVEERNDL